MKFIITAKPADGATRPSPDAPFDEALFTAHMAFNEALHKAAAVPRLHLSGTLAELAPECWDSAPGPKDVPRYPSRRHRDPAGKSARIEVRKGRRTVVDGPFTESKELVGGFYILEVPSIDEAIAWALRCPTGMGFDDVLEIHQLTGEEDVPSPILEMVRKAAPTWSTTFAKRT